jgi:hypothetical protein
VKSSPKIRAELLGTDPHYLISRKEIMETHLVACLEADLVLNPPKTVIDIIRRAKIVVRSVKSKDFSENLLVSKVLRLFVLNSEFDLESKFLSDLTTLLDTGLVAHISNEIKLSGKKLSCCW